MGSLFDLNYNDDGEADCLSRNNLNDLYCIDVEDSDDCFRCAK